MSIKKILSIVLFVTLFGALFIGSITALNNTSIENEAYQYPIQAGTEEWASLGKDEILDLLQIPEEKLSSMTTQALLETVLNYPYISDYFCFNTPQYAYNTFSLDFNGFKALLDRSDVTQVLFSRYRVAKVVSSEEYSMGSTLFEDVFDASTMEFLIVCDQIHNGDYTQEETEKLKVIERKKEEERVDSGLYASNAPTARRSAFHQPA